ncbi:LicD family protein [Bacteroides zhangwenhongii]|uniref:LicD family protein n=1 Tax=Bacteroides zhangwenhongii TaxID=2650157 RepID=UPI000821D6E7|nr:LicD family protein [uncultured Bacteroides sp.]SCH60169.1 LPS biosynthesis protein [uncultured Bacteroides sp.]
MLTKDTDEIKAIQLKLKNILFIMDDVCRKHNLRYYLIAGTLLGAKRHKGFIPWDDDADIGMPRNDYETFLQNAHLWLPERYELVHSQNTPDYPYPFARLQDAQTTYIMRRNFSFIGGIPLDIFPLDGMTQHPIKRWFHYKRYRFFQKVAYYSFVNPYKHGKGIYYYFVTACRTLFSPTNTLKKLNDIQQEYNYEKSDLVADHDNLPYRGILPKEVYGEPTPIEFEGKKLMGVANTEAYLKYCYGNYMEIPSLNKRSKRNYRYMNPNLPYKLYKKHTNKNIKPHDRI